MRSARKHDPTDRCRRCLHRRDNHTEAAKRGQARGPCFQAHCRGGPGGTRCQGFVEMPPPTVPVLALWKERQKILTMPPTKGIPLHGGAA